MDGERKRKNIGGARVLARGEGAKRKSDRGRETSGFHALSFSFSFSILLTLLPAPHVFILRCTHSKEASHASSFMIKWK